MKRTVSPFLLLAVLACSGEPSADPAAPQQPVAAPPVEEPVAEPPVLDDSDCNLSTPLVPGVPGSPGNLIVSERNPNGDSELAVLMRRFVDDLKEARLRAQAGEPMPAMFPTHRMMRCAWPTKPEERNEAYDGRAQTYLTAVRAFDVAPNQITYNGIVQSCVACHQVSCDGVIPFIETLKWQ